MCPAAQEQSVIYEAMHQAEADAAIYLFGDRGRHRQTLPSHSHQRRAEIVTRARFSIQITQLGDIKHE